jgi:hypothetical protein
MTAHASTVAEPGPAPTLAGTETLQEGDVIAWSPVLGADDWVELGQAETPAAGSTAETEAQPLATTTRAAVSCGSSTSVLEKYSSKYDGTIKLECGSAGGFGLKHILSSHPEQQWRNQMGGPGNVQDFIKYLIRGGLSAPSKKGNVSASNKRCYADDDLRDGERQAEVQEDDQRIDLRLGQQQARGHRDPQHDKPVLGSGHVRDDGLQLGSRVPA